MAEFIKLMLSEGSSVSALRVMCFISLIIGGSLAAYGMYKGVNLTELSILCSVFIGSAFGGKVMQKLKEKSNDSK